MKILSVLGYDFKLSKSVNLIKRTSLTVSKGMLNCSGENPEAKAKTSNALHSGYKIICSMHQLTV